MQCAGFGTFLVKRGPGRPKNIEAASRRKEQILSSASRMFAANGYAETNLDNLAAELDLSKGTIYRYFNSKSELFFATVDREFQRLTQSVPDDTADAQNPLDVIVQANAAYLGFFKENPHAVELIMQERAAFPDRDPRIASALNNPILGKWRDLIQDLMDAGYVRKMPLDNVLEFLSNSLYGTVMSDTLRRPGLDLEALARDSLDIIIRGVATEKARREWNLNDN